MPRVENKPLSADPGLMGNIQSEVPVENRPLLDFIISKSKFLVGIVVLLVVALLGTAVYRYVEGSQRETTLEELARIMQRPADARQIADIEALGRDCPSSMRTAVSVALVQSALTQGLRDKAEEGYAQVASADFDSPTGLAAALNQAGMLMGSGKYAEGVRIVQSLLPRLGQQSGVQARMMLAEGAFRAGQYDLAASTFEELAGTVPVQLDKDYCAARAGEIRAIAKAEQAENSEQ